MRRMIAMGFFAALFGCSEPSTQVAGSDVRISQDDIDRAALSALWPIPSRSDLFPEPDAVLDRDQKWVDEKRAWALTLEDRRYRNAYLRWVDYVQRGIKENREENRTHARANEFKRWDDKRQAERDREAAVTPNLPNPPH